MNIEIDHRGWHPYIEFVNHMKERCAKNEGFQGQTKSMSFDLCYFSLFLTDLWKFSLFCMYVIVYLLYLEVYNSKVIYLCF